MVTELKSALVFLRERLSPSFVAALGGASFCQNLLDHLRTRREPALPFTPAHLPEICHMARELDPDEFAWERRIADEAVAGRLYAASNPYCDRFLPMDPERFDFSEFDHFDPQSIHGLNRMRWLPALAQHYWDRRDTSRFDALMRQWDFFAERVDLADTSWLDGVHRIGTRFSQPPHSELDTYIRLTNWWWAYWLALFAEPMTAERNAVLLARCLRQFDAVAARGIMLQEHNFTSMEMEAVYLWAATLPEASGMSLWKHNARTNLQSSLGRAVLPDGGQWEMSISYQVGCVRWYGMPALLAARQGETWPEAYTDRIVAMAEMVDRMVLPDATLPAVGDSDRTAGWRSALAIVRALRPGVRFVHRAEPTYVSLWRTDGATPDAAEPVEAEPVRVFPDTGIAVLHAGEGQRAAMVIMKNSMRRPSHAHEDNLTVLFEAFGRPVVVDPGRWIYDRSPDRMWVTSAVAHNTAWIADRPPEAADFDDAACQGRFHERWFHLAERTGGALVGVTTGDSDTEMRHAATRFRGFVGDRSAEVARDVWLASDAARPWLVVVDRFTSSREHRWANSWLVPCDGAMAATEQGAAGQLADGLGLQILVATDGRELALEQESKFWCRNYAEKEPATWLRFVGPVTCGVRAFAFIPDEGRLRDAHLALADGAVMLQVDGAPHEMAIRSSAGD